MHPRTLCAMPGTRCTVASSSALTSRPRPVTLAPPAAYAASSSAAAPATCGAAMEVPARAVKG